jgi:hypothetical protein
MIPDGVFLRFIVVPHLVFLCPHGGQGLGSGSPQQSQPPRETPGSRRTADRLMDLLDYPVAIQYYRHILIKIRSERAPRPAVAFAYPTRGVWKGGTAVSRGMPAVSGTGTHRPSLSYLYYRDSGLRPVEGCRREVRQACSTGVPQGRSEKTRAIKEGPPEEWPAPVEERFKPRPPLLRSRLLSEAVRPVRTGRGDSNRLPRWVTTRRPGPAPACRHRP